MLMTFSTFDSELSWSGVVRPLDDRDLCAGHAHFRRLWNRQRIADRRRRSIGVQIRRYLSSAFVVLNLIAVGILVLFFGAIFPAVDWTHVFNVSSPGGPRRRRTCYCGAGGLLRM